MAGYITPYSEQSSVPRRDEHPTNQNKDRAAPRDYRAEDEHPTFASKSGDAYSNHTPDTSDGSENTTMYKSWLDVTVTDIIIAFATVVSAVVAVFVLKVYQGQRAIMEIQSEISNRQLDIQKASQRAFISYIDMPVNPHSVSRPDVVFAVLGPMFKDYDRFIVHPMWQNTGVTEARDVVVWASGPYFVTLGADDDFIDLPPLDTTTQTAPIGPHVTFFGRELSIDAEMVRRVMRREGEVIVGAGAYYRDIFNDPHETITWSRLDIYAADPFGPTANWGNQVPRAIRFMSYKNYSRYS